MGLRIILWCSLCPLLVSGCTFAPRVAEISPDKISTYNYSGLSCEELFDEVKKIRAITTKLESEVEGSWSILSKESNSLEAKMLADARGRAKALQSLIRKKRC
jgi:hypothetical protein